MGRSQRRRVVVGLFLAFCLLALPQTALAASGWLSCSGSNHPATNSISTTNTTHHHYWRSGYFQHPNLSYAFTGWLNAEKSGIWQAFASTLSNAWGSCFSA